MTIFAFSNSFLTVFTLFIFIAVTNSETCASYGNIGSNLTDYTRKSFCEYFEEVSRKGNYAESNKTHPPIEMVGKEVEQLNDLYKNTSKKLSRNRRQLMIPEEKSEKIMLNQLTDMLSQLSSNEKQKKSLGESKRLPIKNASTKASLKNKYRRLLTTKQQPVRSNTAKKQLTDALSNFKSNDESLNKLRKSTIEFYKPPANRKDSRRFLILNGIVRKKQHRKTKQQDLMLSKLTNFLRDSLYLYYNYPQQLIKTVNKHNNWEKKHRNDLPGRTEKNKVVNITTDTKKQQHQQLEISKSTKNFFVSPGSSDTWKKMYRNNPSRKSRGRQIAKRLVNIIKQASLRRQSSTDHNKEANNAQLLTGDHTEPTIHKRLENTLSRHNQIYGASRKQNDHYGQKLFRETSDRDIAKKLSLFMQRASTRRNKLKYNKNLSSRDQGLERRRIVKRNVEMSTTQHNYRQTKNLRKLFHISGQREITIKKEKEKEKKKEKGKRSSNLNQNNEFIFVCKTVKNNNRRFEISGDRTKNQKTNLQRSRVVKKHQFLCKMKHST